MKNRALKVHWTRYGHPIKGKDAYYLPPPVPYVLLKSYWLEDSNFQIGNVVSVDVQKNKLILTTAPA